MRRSQKGTAAAILFLVLAAFPLAGRAGVADMLSVLAAIRSALNGMGQTLGQFQTLEAEVSALEQQVVWPARAIAQAQASIRQVRSQFSSLSRSIQGIAVNSATLEDTQRLEGQLRGSTSVDFHAVASSYASVYRYLPNSGQATEAQRNLMDMDDALALEGLKSAAISDLAGGAALAVADGIEAEALQTAPGSAGMLAAEAETGSLQSQAMLQKLLAAQLRQEAAILAQRNARRKQSADSLKQLRNNLLHVLGGH
jgi:hypothetical protein